MSEHSDRFDLERFVQAQQPVHECVLAELRAGRASAARRAWTTVEPSREQPKRDGDMQGTSVRGEESCCG